MRSRLRPFVRFAVNVSLLVLGIAPQTFGQCTDADGDGFFYELGCGTTQDCNDGDSSIYPGAVEVCDGYDNDCDGQMDNDPTCETTCSLPETIGDESRLTSAPGISRGPSLAWAGSEYAVTWCDTRATSNYQIYFAHFDHFGNKIGSDVRISQSDGNACGLSLAWTGSEYGVVWSGADDEIHFVRLDASGNQLGSELVLTNAAGNSDSPSIVWTGSEYGVAWLDVRLGDWNLYFARVDATGNKIGDDLWVAGPVGPLVVQFGAPSLVWTGSEYGLSWVDYRVRFVRLDAQGHSIGSEVAVSTGDSPSLVWNGSEFGLAWRSSTASIEFINLDALGNPIGGSVRVDNDPSSSSEPFLAWNGSEYAVAWYDGRHDHNEIYVARMGATGSNLVEVRVTHGTQRSQDPTLAWTGSEYGVAYHRGSFSEIYFSRIGCNCFDGDGDGTSICNDCDDSDDRVYAAAPQFCDQVNNDCDDPIWPTLPPAEADLDNDGIAQCEGDCDDADGDVYSGAPQVCDGVNNDCDDPSWPTVPPDDADSDADGYAICEGDCDDQNFFVKPGSREACNGVDDDCNGLTDDDVNGEDSDGDGVANACDNCVAAYNPLQDDVDLDTVGDSCDNCILDWNADQADFDGDLEGDRCDHDDGFIRVFFDVADRIDWEIETGFDSWNCYVGDLDELESSGIYTQAPGSNPLADRGCSLSDPYMDVVTTPGPGSVAFHLVTGMSGGVESSLGNDSAGTERPNDGTCAP